MQGKIHSSFTLRLSSGLLLLLFICIYLLQAFHVHRQASIPDNGSSEQQYVAAAEQCTICDYLARTRQEVFDLTYPLVLPAPLPKEIEVNGWIHARMYKPTLRQFSNKGPPSIFA